MSHLKLIHSKPKSSVKDILTDFSMLHHDLCNAFNCNLDSEFSVGSLENTYFTILDSITGHRVTLVIQLESKPSLCGIHSKSDLSLSEAIDLINSAFIKGFSAIYLRPELN